MEIIQAVRLINCLWSGRIVLLLEIYLPGTSRPHFTFSLVLMGVGDFYEGRQLFELDGKREKAETQKAEPAFYGQDQASFSCLCCCYHDWNVFLSTCTKTRRSKLSSVKKFKSRPTVKMISGVRLRLKQGGSQVLNSEFHSLQSQGSSGTPVFERQTGRLAGWR